MNILLEAEVTDSYIIDASRAFVGLEHGKKPALAKDVVEKIKKIGDKYGYWYEGGGGDKEVVKPLFGDIEYEGSWDEEISSEKIKNEYVYVFTLFSNTAENSTVQKVSSVKGKTVFEKALNSRKQWAHEAIRDKSKEEFEDLMNKFFSKLGRDYYKDSQAEATDDNVASFIESVESDMWDNWPDGNGPAFEMAFEANSDRDNKLLKKFKTGVFFIGMGHIELLNKLMTK
jgi:hypothetical protein